MCFPDGLVRRMIRGEQGVSFDRPSPTYNQKDFVPIEVKAGSLVVIHGDLIHQRLVEEIPFVALSETMRKSLFGSKMASKLAFSLCLHCSFENQSLQSRHAYSWHVVDTDGCKWAPDNW